MQTLFPDSFIRAICQLRIAANRVSPSGDRGEHISRRAGAGMEFRDYRAYVPGDDLRRVDWNVYRRSRRLVLRLADEPRELPFYVMLDVSDSMFFESPPRADAGRQVAAALVAAAMHEHDRIAVYGMGSGLGVPFKLGSPRGLPKLLSGLANLRSLGATAMSSCLREFIHSGRPAGVVALISDFFDPDGLEPVLESLAGLRHRLILVQLTRAADRDPGLQGDLELLDCETGSPLQVTATEPELKQYRESYDAFQARLHEYAVRRAAKLARIDCDGEVLPQLSQLFVGGILRV